MTVHDSSIVPEDTSVVRDVDAGGRRGVDETTERTRARA
jgi:hypothetical protein